MCDGKIVLALPDWVGPFLEKAPAVFENIEDRMRLAIELSKLNVENETGGPFGAAVFEQDSGKLIAVGVLFSLAGFFVCDRCLSLWVGQIEGTLDYERLPIYALPFLLLVIQLFTLVIEPLQHAVSRHFERQADRYALRRTGDAESFRSFFLKLARMNKAELNPPRWEVLLLHSHPPIAERIAAAEAA